MSNTSKPEEQPARKDPSPPTAMPAEGPAPEGVAPAGAEGTAPPPAAAPPVETPQKKRFLRRVIEAFGDWAVRRVRRARIIADRGARGLYYRVARRYFLRKIWPYFRWLEPPAKLIYAIVLRPIELFHRRTPVPVLRALYWALFLGVLGGAGYYFWTHRPTGEPDAMRHPDITREALPAKLAERISDLVKQGKLAEARRQLDNLRKQVPDHHIVHTLAGIIRAEQGDLEGARAEYQLAAEAAPGNFNAQFNLAEVDFLLGNYAAAREGFSVLAAANPRTEQITFRLYLCALLLEDMTSADALLDALSPKGKTPAWFYASAARLFRENKRNEAHSLLSRAAVLYPKDREFFDATLRKLGLD